MFHSRIRTPRTWPGAALALLALLFAQLLLPAAFGSDQGNEGAQEEEVGEQEAEEVTFRHPLDDEPIDIQLPEGEARTEAVEHFHRTGENLYAEGEGREEAIAEGRERFMEWCSSCHAADGTGGMGPSLVDDRYRYDRTDTAIGMFEIIHAGGTGAMQSFADRLTQDEVLKIIAFIDHLRSEEATN